MANEQQTRPSFAPVKGPAGQEPIEIAEIRFSRPTGADVPIPSAHGGLARIIAGERHGETFAIRYLPWLRRYEVKYSGHLEGNKPVVFWIHETWVIAIPQEQSW